MIVNRVFCYSKDIAKQNGNKLPILQLILATVIFIVGLVAIAVVLADNMTIFMLATFAFIGVIVYYSVILGLRLRARMTGFAKTNDGRISKDYYKI